MGGGKSPAKKKAGAKATATATLKQTYLDKINSATTLNQLDDIGEEIAYDDNLTNAEISELILYGQSVAQSWQPTANQTTAGQSVIDQAKLNSAADEYKKKADYAATIPNKYSKNYFEREEANYRDLEKAAHAIKPTQSKFEGIETLVALTNAKEGDKFLLTGSTHPGVYELRDMGALGKTKGWVQRTSTHGYNIQYSPYIFANSLATVAKEMGLVDSEGRYRKKKGVSATFTQ